MNEIKAIIQELEAAHRRNSKGPTALSPSQRNGAMELKSPLPGLVTWQMVALLGLSTWLLWRRRRAVELVLEDAELFAAQKELSFKKR